MLAQALAAASPGLQVAAPAHRPFCAGDVRHLLADVDKAHTLLGYRLSHDIKSDLAVATGWFAAYLAA